MKIYIKGWLKMIERIIWKAEHGHQAARKRAKLQAGRVGVAGAVVAAAGRTQAWAAEERDVSLETQSAVPHCTKTLELTSKQSWSK